MTAIVQRGLRIPIGKTRMLVVTPGKVFLYGLMLIAAAFMALPLVYVAVTAFKPYEELFLFPPRFFVKNPTGDNFAQLIGAFDSSSIPFLRYLFNSLLVTTISVCLTILVSSLAAYGFAKKRVPYGNALFSLIIVALSFPVQATQISNYMVVNAMGLVNTLWALVIPKIAVAYNLFLMKQFCEQIPNTLLEAARVDGSGELRIFFQLVFPTLKPAWATLCVLSFVANWNDYFSPLVFLTDESLRTLPLALNSLAENGNIARAGAVAAGTFIMILPTILIFVIMQRRVIETMTFSGIKG